MIRVCVLVHVGVESMPEEARVVLAATPWCWRR